MGCICYQAWLKGCIMATGSTMANNSDDAGKPGIEHQETFEGFMAATKWGVIIVSLALILMAIFLV
jgi:uncharacterized integral membrane protein